MKYMGMPWGMWYLYKHSFQKHLVETLHFSNEEAKQITQNAKPKYKEIIQRIPEFEKEDRFKMNIVNCALFLPFYYR